MRYLILSLTLNPIVSHCTHKVGFLSLQQKEIQLRLNPIPESIMSAICQFEDLESAVLTAQQVIQYGIPIARIEMLNKDQMDISIKYSNLENLEIKPTLFFQVNW